MIKWTESSTAHSERSRPLQKAYNGIMVEDFTWAKSHKINTGWKRKGDKINRYHLPSITSSRLNLQNSYAAYNYDKGTLSFELYLLTPFEWLDTRLMRNKAGRKVAEILGVDKWLYYVDQPVGSRHRKGWFVYFQQFVCATGIPSDEQMRACWEVLKDAAIEGVESPEYKYRVSNSGYTPLDRTFSKVAHRKKIREAEYERECD